MTAQVSWKKDFKEEDPIISEDARKIFTQYCKIPEDQIIAHTRSIRDQAWAQYQYPCIGTYMFLDFGIGQTPQYPEVLNRVKSGQTLLDVACCVGQDVRKLIADGAPAYNIFGTELKPEFIELGFELFRDRKTLENNFTTGDFLSSEKAGLQEKSFDLIYAGSFIHLFEWDLQVKALINAVSLLKHKSGSTIFGRQTGRKVSERLAHPASYTGHAFFHNKESFQKLIDEVSATTEIKLRGELQLVPHHVWSESEGWMKLFFAVVVV